MEVLTLFGTPEQQERWLRPLLDGEIRSAFAMTEPDVASSDATNIALRIERDGDEYVLNGRKWWISGALHPHCRILIVMGKTNPDGPRHQQQSMVLCPLDTPGVTVVRGLPVFGYQDQEGHAELLFEDVRVPAENMLAGEGQGFLISQARLGPGRIHHCMRSIGAAERALELMCARALARETFGAPVATRANVQDWIAEARIEIEMLRLLTMKTAWLMDTVGNKHARTEIAAIKVAAPNVALKIIDRAIQVHGGGGVSDDFPLASMYAHMRTLRLADGPDEVHKMTIARHELRRSVTDDVGSARADDQGPRRATACCASPCLLSKRPTLIVTCLATAMLMLDIAVVNTAMAHIGGDLHAGLDSLKWVVDAYTLALATTVVTIGSLADRFGRRNVFAAGLVVFTVASLVCALADSIAMLNAARVVQGIGASGLFASSLALLVNAYPEQRERNGAMADLRRHDRRLVRDRPARRRRADQRPELALDLPDQPADRHRRPRRHAAARRRVQGPGRPARRRPGPDRADRRAVPARAGAAARQRRRLGRDLDDRGARRRGGAAARVRRHRAPRARADAAARPVPRPGVRRRRRSRCSRSRPRSSRSTSTRRSTSRTSSASRRSRPAWPTCPAR